MKITKRVTFEDVNAGYMHLANLSTGCPTVIKGKAYVSSPFIGHSIQFYLKLDPTSGGNISTALNNGASGLISETTNEIYTEVGGELLVQLTDASSGVSTGEAIILVEVEMFPLS
jgi:hypothetical protein